MDNGETIEGNELISKFMGYQMDNDGYYLLPGSLSQFRDSDHAEWCSTKSISIDWHNPESIEIYGYYWQISPDHLLYHLSWDWIIPVIHKIGSMEFGETEGLEDYMENKFVNEFSTKIHIFCTITQVWTAVVNFINWYNKQEKSNEENIRTTQN